MDSYTSRNGSQTSERTPLLLVVNADGFCQLYGNAEKLDVCVVQQLDVPDGPEAAQLADQYIEIAAPVIRVDRFRKRKRRRGLPPDHRQILEPNSLITTHMPARITPVEALDADHYLDVIHTINRVTPREDEKEQEDGDGCLII